MTASYGCALLLHVGLKDSSVEKLANPKDFFHALYHRFLCSADQGLRLECDSSLLDASQVLKHSVFLLISR
jgi:hypothetical protein